MVAQVDAADRHRRILDRLEADGRVEVADLASLCVVAPETIRRDLRLLEDQGQLQRVHGGAVRRAERPLSPFDGTDPEHPADHVRLADAVVDLLPTHGTLFLGSGRLTWAVADSLSRRPPPEPGLTVVTTSLDVAVVLSRAENLHVYNTGGSVDPPHHGQQGAWALEEIRRFRVDLALLSPAGATLDGVFETDPLAAAVTAEVLQLANRAWLLLEPGRLGHEGPVRAGDLTRVRRLVALGADGLDSVDFHEAGIDLISVD